MKKKSLQIVFRADASVQIGTGHVMRCLTLADEFIRQGHQCHFICRDHEGHLGELIASKGYDLHLLSGNKSAVQREVEDIEDAHADWLGVPWQQDAAQTLEVLSSLKAGWLVVDHYALDARWEREISTLADRIMVIDDLADRNHECALLLDQNLGRQASDYDGRVPADCIRLIGPSYSLLRPEFARLRGRSLRRRQKFELKRILISLGGVDRTNVTGKVLNALAETPLSPETKLDIILGASAPYLAEVQQQAELLPFRAAVSVDVRDMAERMCLADLSIGAAGSTSWERCCLGLTAVLVIQAENQISGARALEASGAAMVIGNTEEVQAALPAALVKVNEAKILKRMSRAAAEITTGEGVTIIVDNMTKIVGRSQ